MPGATTAGTATMAVTSSGFSTAASAAAIAFGFVLAGCVLISALETVVLPRNSFTRITRVTFAVIDRVIVHRWRTAERTDYIRGLYAPVALVSLPLVWMVSIILAFSFIFWGVGSGTWTRSFEISGSSVTTLGFAAPTGSGRTWFTFIEAIIGLGLVALLISYLPTIYAAYHDREKGMRTIRPFAGTPASGIDLLSNLVRFNGMDNPDLWRNASAWLLELDQTHCAFPALCYFPESDPEQSWVATVGAILDAAALMLSSVSLNVTDPSALGSIPHQGTMVVLAHGVPALSAIGRAAGLPIDPPPPLLQLIPDESGTAPDISVTRADYFAALDRLTSIVVVPDAEREQAWQRFAVIRSAYDKPLRGLAGLTLATPSEWTTDRPAQVGRPRLVTRRPIKVDWSLPAT